jgi:threonine dehydrogenase-like Zn-dependent dehydrogenase
MRALWFENGRATLDERPIPAPGPDEALIRVLMAGICGTDLELQDGYYGFSGIPGHEFVGRVEACACAPDLVGRRVVADINLGCGTCPDCRAGDPRHCPARTVVGIRGRDGAMAESLALPARALHAVDDAIPDQEAVFAEPLAAALRIADQVAITPDSRVLVLGDGRLGLLCALALRHFAPGLTLAGRHPDKLAIAARAGVATALSPAPEGPSAPLATPLSVHGPFDLVVEATGRPEGLAQALSLTRPRGTIVAKTTSRLPSTLNLARLVVDEITLLGSRCGNMAQALAFLAGRRVDARPLVQAVFPFSQAQEALEAARRPGALKVLLDLANSKGTT